MTADHKIIIQLQIELEIIFILEDQFNCIALIKILL